MIQMGDTIPKLSIPPILICNSDMMLSSRDVLSKAGEVVAVRSNIKPKNVDMILHIPSSVRFSAPKLHTSASSTCMWLKPHPPTNVLAIVIALSRQPLTHTGIKASPLEMGAVQGERTVFSTRSCIGRQQWPTQSQPSHFQSGDHRRPCCLHPNLAISAEAEPISKGHCRKWRHKMKVSCQIYPGKV